MKDSEKIRILDDTILSLEIAHEKAAVMLDCLNRDYFSLDDAREKLRYFDTAVTQNEILLDYIFQIGQTLAKTRRRLREWSAEKEKEQ